MLTVDQAIVRVKRQWKKKGPGLIALAVAEILFRPLIRGRCRLVMYAPLEAPRESSVWGPSERLVVIGPDNIDDVSPELLASLEPEKHLEDFQGIRKGNLLFVVAYETHCLYRSYACTVERPGLRNSVFFGEWQGLPEIRSAQMSNFIPAPAVKGLLRGLHSRVLNEQLRWLHKLGFKRVVLYITAENTVSIRGAVAAGFRPCRTLTDWILFRSLVFQRVSECSSNRWRVFCE